MSARNCDAKKVAASMIQSGMRERSSPAMVLTCRYPLGFSDIEPILVS